MIGPAPAKINLALVVGPAASRRQARARDRLPARSTSATGSTSSRARRDAGRRVRGRHARPQRARARSRRRDGWRVADREAHSGRGRPRRRELRRGRPRCGSRTRSSTSRSPAGELHALAARLGADVPFFLRDGPQLGTGDGTALEPLDLPQDFAVLLVLPAGAAKRVDGRRLRRVRRARRRSRVRRARGALRAALARVRRPRDLAALPPNDLACSPLAEPAARAGAFRADVSGAGPWSTGSSTTADARARAAAR